MNVTDATNAMVTQTRKVLAMAFAKYDIPLPAEAVEVRCDIRGRCHGRAIAKHSIGKYTIRLNPEAYLLDQQEMMEDTIPHEVAHIVCMIKPTLGRNHDHGWKRVCRELGGSAKVTGDLGLTPARVSNKFIYVVDNQEIDIGPTQHQRIQAGASYSMRGTGTRILPQHWVDYDAAKAKVHVSQHGNVTFVRTTSTSQPVTNKRAAAERLMLANRGESRANIINMFVEQLGMTRDGAATYHYNIKKKYGL